MNAATRVRSTLLALALAPVAATAQSTAATPATPTAVRVADDARWLGPAADFLRRLTTGDFDGASRAASSPQMTPQLLSGAWTGLVAQLGPFVALDAATVSADRDQHVVDTPARFERSSVVLRVVLDSSARVAGFWLQPPKAPVAPPAYHAPAYVHADRFTETEVQVGQGSDALPGTLTLPAGTERVPIVVLVHGSGPNDRDERVGAQYPFRDLAWGLASSGIGVLRYDKRSFANVASMMDAPVTVEREVIADAVNALAVARAHPRAAVVGVAGHSLGGMLAPEIAARDGHAGFVVLLAGSARPLSAVLEEQLRHLASLPRAAGGLDSATLQSALGPIAGLRAHTLPPSTQLFGAPASYFYDLDARDPVRAARALGVPVLAVHGGRDYQVTGADAARWREALSAGHPRSRVVTYPALNHLLMPGTGMATPFEYTSGPANHVDAALVADLAAWIRDATATAGTPTKPAAPAAPHH